MQNTRFDEIVFVDDFFRSSVNLLQSHPTNRRFLRAAFQSAATRLGLRCRELCANTDGGELDVAAMMQALALTPNAAGWARSCISDLNPLVVLGLLPPFRPDTLVVGWGMSPALLKLLDAAGVSFLDVEVAPVRFASHLSFHMRTNDRQLEAVLEAHRIEEESFWNEATAVQAFFARHGAGRIFDPGLRIGLFVGQCAIDLALVGNGRILRPLDVVDGVRTLAREVDLLVLKPHPFEPDLRHLREMAAGIPNVAWTDANLYAMLCADNLRFVCGLSSSAIREAGYFLKEGLQLLTPDRDNRKQLPASCSNWIPTSSDILSLHAMALICMPSAGASAPRAAVSASKLPEDLLDRALGTRWGLDPASNGLSELPRLPPGTDFDFRHGSRGWFSFGWSKPDARGPWTDGERACMVIPLADDPACPEPAPTDPPLRIRIEGHVFGGRPDSRPVVHLRMHGLPAQSVRAEARWTQTARRVFEFELPASAARKVLVIDFDIENPTRPCDCGDSKDSRRLGFQIERLRMDLGAPVQTAPESAWTSAGAMPGAAARRPRHGLRHAAVCLAVAVASIAVLGKVLPFDDDAAAAESSAPPTVAASPWRVFKEKVGADVMLMRTDLQHLLKRHDI